MAPTLSTSDVFPELLCCTKLAGGQQLYDIKFYPYPTADNEQVFAVVGLTDVFVCRTELDADPPFEVLRWVQNRTKGHALNSVAWSRDPRTKKPLLCVAGDKPKQIQLFDIEQEEAVRTLTGHGNAINDLAVSPLSSSILASASHDYTIRLWNLEPEYEEQPCVAIFAGEGHRQPVLACHFHPNGKWMLSGGLDTAVCLWAVPGLEKLKRHHSEAGHPKPKTVYYPHFHSTEVHANYIDCLAFYGDLILSRAAKDPENPDKSNELLLWRIDGFDSERDAPEEPPIPGSGIFTRSSFQHDKASRGFQRLLTFDISTTSRWYLRFGFLNAPDVRPIICMGNEESKFLFWDLQKLEEGYDPSEEKPAKKPRGRKPKAGTANAVNQSNLDRMGELRKQQSVGSDAASGTADPSSTSLSAPPERKYDLGDPFMPLKPHHSIIANTTLSKQQKKDVHFATRQIAWSPDGTWMIGVGDHGMICIFHRKKSVT